MSLTDELSSSFDNKNSVILVLKKDTITCSKIDNNINEKDGVGHTVEYNPSGGEVVVEEGNGHRKNNQVRNK